jgi:hypothetical protein
MSGCRNARSPIEADGFDLGLSLPSARFPLLPVNGRQHGDIPLLGLRSAHWCSADSESREDRLP